MALQTEGFGPLIFGMLMAMFEHSPQPGSPFVLAAIISLWAFLHCFELPPEADMDLMKRYELSYHLQQQQQQQHNQNQQHHNEHSYDPLQRLLRRDDSSSGISLEDSDADDSSTYSSRSTGTSPLIAGKNTNTFRL